MSIKKNLLYIFVLVLIGIIFIPSTKTQAGQVTGKCYSGNTLLYNVKDENICTTLKGSTKNQWVTNTPILDAAGTQSNTISTECVPPQIDDGTGNCVTPINGDGCPDGTVLGADGSCTTPSDASPLVRYELLQPLPCKNGDAGCDANGQLKVYNPSGTGKLGQYLNLMINLFIGLCAVAALVMIVLGGIEYSGSELISGKEAGKERIKNAIFGLLLALCSWLILYTINPDLLNTEVDIGNATLTSNGEIDIPDIIEPTAAQTIDGKPGKPINFSKEACPAAKVAEAATGVDRALVLGIFGQESGGGRNTGHCNYTNSGMGSKQLACLREIAPIIGKDIGSINMSCSGAGGNGGAMGVVQFIPCTYKQNLAEAQRLLGHAPDPWNISDAFTLAAVKLKNDGGITNPYGAACSYFGKCSLTTSSGTVNYAAGIIAKMNNIKSQNRCP